VKEAASETVRAAGWQFVKWSPCEVENDTRSPQPDRKRTFAPICFQHICPLEITVATDIFPVVTVEGGVRETCATTPKNRKMSRSGIFKEKVKKRQRPPNQFGASERAAY